MAFNHVSGGGGSDEVLGGGVCIINYHITTFFFNNIVWGNTVDAETGLGEDIHNGFECSASHICYNDYSSLSGEPPANTCPECDAPPYGNLNVDPLFVNPAEGDFHLQAGSPVIDMGTASAPGLPDTDVEGNPRVTGAAPDMGAYEAGRKGDFDGDGDIDLVDFFLFAAAYGSELGDDNYNPAGDFNDNDVINLYDFFLFAAVYGT